MAANGVVAHRWVPETKSAEGFSYDVSKPEGSREDIHVLAVDDSHVDRKVIERLLKISSCKVTSVDSGRRALQFLGLLDGGGEKSSSVGSRVDLIITDYCMPGMTGYELLKKLKESSTFKEVPVVIMSSENVVARIDRCLEEGAEEFLVKPVKLSDVKRLRDYMTTTREVKVGDNQQESSETKINSHNINKRKLRESNSDVFPSSTSSSSAQLLISPLPSPSPSPSKFPLPVTCASPTSLDSPTRRLKLTSSEKLEID